MSEVHTSKDFPPSFHRVTIKGLIVKDGKILLFKEYNGHWELPGGGLDFGENIEDALKREIEEESKMKVKEIAKRPMYAWTWRFEGKRDMEWFYALVLAYEAKLENFDFTSSDSCNEIGFFSKEELKTIPLNYQTQKLVEFFDPEDFE